MIRFFRQFRQRQITNNHFSKYLLYAVGEIVLVVVGILIALQINNWNEYRQARVSELSFLSRIREDLITDNAYFKRRVGDSERYVATSGDFLKTLSEEQRSFDDVTALGKLFGEFYSSEMLTTQNSTFSEMLYAGKLELITHAGLKSLLLDYYRRNEEVAKHVSEFNGFTVDAFNIMIDKATNIFPMQMYLDTRFTFDKEYGYLNDPSSEKFQIIAYTAQVYGSKHAVFLTYFKELEALSGELIQLIEAGAN